MRLLITGGAGFIGSALIRHLLADTSHEILNLDLLTYAAAPGSLAEAADDPRYGFIQADVGDAGMVGGALSGFAPDAVIHLAAESHVDRSLDDPAPFVRTNIVGTFTLLEEVLRYWRCLPPDRAARFRFHHVSTDEVFGSLDGPGKFAELSSYAPRSPYSASKAASDHLARAWFHSFGLPVIVSNATNNYGAFQSPEKLIPLTIARALRGQDLPVYGDGRQVRDWLFVDDHARALLAICERGEPGRTYGVSAGEERCNIDVVRGVCALLDHLSPRDDGQSYAGQIRFVEDRPGHDRRCAFDAARLRSELGWSPGVDFAAGLERTVRWYVGHRAWWQSILDRNDLTARQGRPR